MQGTVTCLPVSVSKVTAQISCHPLNRVIMCAWLNCLTCGMGIVLYKVVLYDECCEYVCVLRLLLYRYIVISVFMGGNVIFHIQYVMTESG